MSVYKRFLLVAGGLLSFMCLIGIPSLALADDDEKGNGQKVTICHIPNHGKMRPRTLKLPAHVAERHKQSHPNDFFGECGGTKFVIVAVSGTLEEGFPLRPNLDFLTEVNEGNPEVRAIFLGHALIRGLRAFLDIKDPNSREFREPPAFNPVNPALVPSGNKFDANISSIYLVDRRQAARALLNEPRYLSMVPDLAKVDIHADETSPAVRALILQAIQETPLLEPKNVTQATFLQVISTWKSCHFVPSPVLHTKGDGTRVTDFPNSLATYAGTTDAERISDPASYNAKVEAAIRAAVETTKNCVEPGQPFPVPFPAEAASYAVDKKTKRMNDTYQPCQFEEFAARAGLNIQVEQCPNLNNFPAAKRGMSRPSELLCSCPPAGTLIHDVSLCALGQAPLSRPTPSHTHAGHTLGAPFPADQSWSPDKGASDHFGQIGRCMTRPLVQMPATGYVVLQMASTRPGENPSRLPHWWGCALNRTQVGAVL